MYAINTEISSNSKKQTMRIGRCKPIKKNRMSFGPKDQWIVNVIVAFRTNWTNFQP